MLRHGLEVFVRREEVQAVTDGKPGQEGVDGADLNSAPPTVVAERCRLDMVLNLGHDHREQRELLDYPPALRRSMKPLK